MMLGRGDRRDCHRGQKLPHGYQSAQARQVGALGTGLSPVPELGKFRPIHGLGRCQFGEVKPQPVGKNPVNQQPLYRCRFAGCQLSLQVI